MLRPPPAPLPGDGKLTTRQPQLSGAYLMRAGLAFNLQGDFDSTAVVLRKVAP